MKTIIIFFTVLSLGSIFTGFLWDSIYSQKMIGFGVVGLFIIVFPLFSYHRWKGKNLKDYMLTKENLDKMKKSNKNF